MFARILGAAVVLAAAAALLVAGWPQLFGLQQTAGVAQVVALRGVAASAATIALILFVVIALLSRGARRFFASLAVVLLAFIGLTAAVLGTRGIGNPGMPTAAEADVTVLAWNTLGDAPGPSAVATLIAESGADVVALPETTWTFADEVVTLLAADGIEMQTFTAAYDQISRARSTTLLVSTALGEYTADLSAPTTSQLPSVVAVPVDGSGPTLIALHAVAPIEGEMVSWRADLQWMAEQCADPNVIIAGDANSTVDHWAGLTTADGAAIGGCVDAAVATGNGAVGTWPTAVPPLLGSPIDHVLAGPDWSATGFRVIGSHDGHGSDHRPVLAQLTPALAP